MASFIIGWCISIGWLALVFIFRVIRLGFGTPLDMGS